MEHRNAKDAIASWKRKNRKKRIPKLLCKKRGNWKMAPKAMIRRDSTNPITICTYRHMSGTKRCEPAH